MAESMKINALLPYFGGKRSLAPRIVTELGQHKYYFEGCAGSMAVLFAKEPSEHETVCDLHRGMTNLAWAVQEDDLAPLLFERLQRTTYGDELFLRSTNWLADKKVCDEILIEVPGPCIDWAYHYFIASWMGRNGMAGTAAINYQIATRWTKGGGGGPLRFRNAVDSIPAWCERLRNVHILRRDVFDVLPKVADDDGVSIYVDPPYIEEGGQYLHGFDELVNFTEDASDKSKPAKKITKHDLLARQLATFKNARIVVSYYAHPLLAKLYPGWTIIDASRQKHLHSQGKRGKGLKTAPEVLLLNGPSLMPDERILREDSPLFNVS